jgi:hypothetical protein
MTVVDPPPGGPERGRSADILSACHVGGSTTVWFTAWTVVDPPRLGNSCGGGVVIVDPSGQTVVDPPT